MSPLPSEVLEDVLYPLDRRTLDVVQFTNRRILQLILGRLSDVCLREIRVAGFHVHEGYAHWTMDSNWKQIHNNKEDTSEGVAHMFSKFLQALRSSRVEHLALNVCASPKGLIYTPALATLVLETPIITRRLRLAGGSFDELTPTQFRELVLHFSPSTVHLIRCDLRPSQVSDEFLRALFTRGVIQTWIDATPPEEEERDAFHVTDDGVIDFFAQDDVQFDEEEEVETSTSRFFRPELALHKHNGSFTKDLFKRLVEASAVSTRERPFRVRVSPVRFDDGDLRDFEQHLSYRNRGEDDEERIYDFPGEIPWEPEEPDEEESTEMHLQIVLNPNKGTLSLRRARLPYRVGWEYSDE